MTEFPVYPNLWILSTRKKVGWKPKYLSLIASPINNWFPPLPCVPTASLFSYHPVLSQYLPSPIWVYFLYNLHFCAQFMFITCWNTSTYNNLFPEQRTENPCVGGSNPPLPSSLTHYFINTYISYSLSILSTIPLQNTLLRPKCVPFFLLTSAEPVQFVSYFEEFLRKWKK